MNLPTKEEINPGIEKSLKELVEISQKIDFSKENQDIKDAMSLFFNSQIDEAIDKLKNITFENTQKALKSKPLLGEELDAVLRQLNLYKIKMEMEQIQLLVTKRVKTTDAMLNQLDLFFKKTYQNKL